MNKRTIIILFIFLLSLSIVGSISAQSSCKADFYAKPTSGCSPLTVTYYDDSDNAVAWNWNFPGGTPSSASGQGPHTIVYNTPGTYNAGLQINCKLGSDQEIKYNFVTVTDCCEPDFSAQPRSGEKPLTVVFTDQSTGADYWHWIFPGGTPSETKGQGPHTVRYDNAGKYDVTLEIGCAGNITDTLTKPDYIDVKEGESPYDFGDAPDSYGTSINNSGAHHTIVQGMFLGQSVDGEVDGLPGKEANGDDNDGIDDEDGIKWPDKIYRSETSQVTVIASQGGNLKAWIDFNHNGEFDPSEMVIDGQVGSGENTMNILIPEDAEDGVTYSRFRYSASEIIGPRGPVFGGEVEDAIIEIFPLPFYDFGDAPDGKLAYKGSWLEFTSEDVIGDFTTCGTGTYSRIRHGNRGTRYFGDSVDFESDGNGGCCDCGYDQDETYGDGDAGLTLGNVYTIVGNELTARPVFVGGYSENQMIDCEVAQWGRHLDLHFYVDSEDGAYINVLIDWNQDGTWNTGGAFWHCDIFEPPHIDEYVLQDFYVPQGRGSLGNLLAPDFRVSAPPGYKWMRCTITESPVDNEDWTGAGNFNDGETEDYLIYISRDFHRDYGDAPNGNPAYPFMNPEISANFPTCGREISHGNESGYFNMFFGCPACQPTIEPSGQRGMCRHGYNQDDDRSLVATTPYTIRGTTDTAHVEVEYKGRDNIYYDIGRVCQMASWGWNNLNIAWVNQYADQYAYVNVLIDWDQDGEWGGTVPCDAGTAEEHVLKNYRLPPAASSSSLRGHRLDPPPDFRIGPNSGYVWARFTISPEPIPLPWDGTGDFEDGETEDYLLKVLGNQHLMDFGDIAGYYTGFRDDGANHLIQAGFHLGALIDSDNDGQEDDDAEGDDKDGSDDDDGVKFKTPLVPGSAAEITVTASEAGILNAWIDFDRNGTWADDTDHFLQDYQLKAGEQNITFMVPANAAPGATYARFRLSKVTGLSYSGPRFSPKPQQDQTDLPPVGEVEDYKVKIEAVDDQEYDFGDAPDPNYPTLAIHSAAWHIIDPTLYMGNTIDAETDGQPTATASGDDTDGMDDEDGVQFLNDWVAGDSALINVTVSDSGLLNMWADLNQDGDWADMDEHMIDDEWLNAGTYTLQVLIPLNARFDSCWVRFRFSSQSHLNYKGLAPDGEVEDYVVPGKTTGVHKSETGLQIPETCQLWQNYPNPFNPSTEIRFDLAQSTEVKLFICNVKGQIVKTLVYQNMPAGRHQVQWNGRNDAGRPMPSGIYFARIQAGTYVNTIKLLFLK
jgi:PKD repeat protein